MPQQKHPKEQEKISTSFFWTFSGLIPQKKFSRYYFVVIDFSQEILYKLN
jgi:hypothetical protein